MDITPATLQRQMTMLKLRSLAGGARSQAVLIAHGLWVVVWTLMGGLVFLFAAASAIAILKDRYVQAGMGYIIAGAVHETNIAVYLAFRMAPWLPTVIGFCALAVLCRIVAVAARNGKRLS